MKTASMLLALVVAAPLLAADSRHVEVDDKTDFRAFKTFQIHEGRATSRKQ